VLVGYGRVFTREQNLARQRAALSAAGCAKCFFDKASGKNTDRPELTRMFDYVRPGDVLTVVSLDRLGRSLEDLIGIVGRLKREGVGFQSLHEKLDTTTAGGVFVFRVFAALAEFIRTIIVANTNEGPGRRPWPASGPPVGDDAGEGRVRRAAARRAGPVHVVDRQDARHLPQHPLTRCYPNSSRRRSPRRG